MNAKLRTTLFTLTSVLIIFLLGRLYFTALDFAQAHPGGAELAQHWAAMRAFLLQGSNPYESLSTTVAGSPSLPDTRVDEPFYLLLLYIPFASLKNFMAARALWMLTAWAGLLGMVLLNLSLTIWRPRWGFLGLFLFFGLFWPHNIQAILDGSNVIWLAAVLATALVTLRSENDELAGALLVLASFRWQAMLPVLLLLGLWLLAQRRWRVFAGYGMALTLLLSLAFFLKSDWFMAWLRAAYYNLHHNHWLTLRGLLTFWWPSIGNKIGWGVQILAWLLMLVEWALARRSRSWRHLIWTLAVTLAITPLLGLPVDYNNYVLYFLPITVILAMFDERWKSNGRWVILTFSFLLLAGGWALFWYIHVGLLSPRALFFPLPLLSLLGLYWARWWAVRTPLAVMNQYAAHFNDETAF